MLNKLGMRKRRKPEKPPTAVDDDTTPEIRTPAEGEESVIVPVETIVKLQKHKFQSARSRVDVRNPFPIGSPTKTLLDGSCVGMVYWETTLFVSSRLST